jgi:hypothetical protein
MKMGIVSLVVLSAIAPMEAQSNSGFGVGNIHEGLAIGAIGGAAAAIGLGVTLVILHNRGVAVGCIVELGGRRTFVTADKTAYLVSDASPTLPAGDRVKVKGRKSGTPAAWSIQVDKVLRDYGRCQP